MVSCDSNRFIRLRGARQNNLKGFDLDLPLGRYIVVTGLSGAGKSSLVFDTLHAEGQRRYAETFSAYTRQFLELLDKPRVDAIENIRPSIAIAQTNTVKTSRSTVGTMTELCDYCKVWFSHVAECFDPETGEKVEDDNPATVWRKAHSALAGNNVIVAFRVKRPANLKWKEIFASLARQGYNRCLLEAEDSNSSRQLPNEPACFAAHKIEEIAAKPSTFGLRSSTQMFVVQDRLALNQENERRFMEATETAFHFGHGEAFIFRESAGGGFTENGRFSRGLHSPKTGRTFRPATPALFSFNSPLGACPKCRGFGRIIDIDYRLVIPDSSLSIEAGAIRAFEGRVYGESKNDLIRAARRHGIPTGVPFAALTGPQREFVMLGEPEYRALKARGESYDYASDLWYGLKGFFDWLEGNTYKMHVRVFLSRFRAYNPCPACGGARLQPEALCWKWRGRTLPQLYALSVRGLLALLDQSEIRDSRSASHDHSAAIAFESILARLRYLDAVGLGYLTLDRASRTLSGGEVERVNLTSCLGTSLVDTLFVMDEPSVGLHPRDIARLLGIIRTLTDAGNTVVVVEHDEAMIRAADHVIEIGPGPGSSGGRVVFQGAVAEMAVSPGSITGEYLSGRQRIEVQAHRRPVLKHDPKLKTQNSKSSPWLRFIGATKHNVRKLDLALPLGRLVCLSGVSGSGKSTLLDNVIHQGLLAQRGQMTEDAASIEAIRSDLDLAEIVLVDQSPLSRTPRSNPALYVEAWELIRELYAATPAAQAAGFGAASFSFNSGDGRCDHCQGLGYERVEMQFLSDVFVPCPVCEGRRFKPEVLAVTWNGRSIAGLLGTCVGDALPLFGEHSEIHQRLAALDEVGLGYLTLGQPLNTLSGGEAQRLKLVRYLGEFTAGQSEIRAGRNDILDPKSKIPAGAAHPEPKTQDPEPHPAGALLLLDEPTTGLHPHDVKRLLAVLQKLVDRGHSVVVIEHNLDVLKCADWILEIGPEAGAQGGRIVAEGTPEDLARGATPTAPFLRTALGKCQLLVDISIGFAGKGSEAGVQRSKLLAAEEPAAYGAARHGSETQNRETDVSRVAAIEVIGARENNLQNLSVSIPHHELTVVTGVSGSGKSTLAFDIVFAEGQRRFMESMSPYARQFVEQMPRPALDRLTGIPPTVAIEQRVTRGSRKSTVATITEVAPYLRLLYARLGVQHHPETGRPVTPLSAGQLRRRLEQVLRTPPARRAKRLYLCAPLIRGRKGHHQPIATWIARQGYEWMRIDGRVVPVAGFQKLDRYREHDVEVVVADLKTAVRSQKSAIRKSRSSEIHLTADLRPPTSCLEEALRLGKGACFLLTQDGKVLSWFSTTRTDVGTGESFPELDPKHFSFNSPRGWCPACRGHGRILPWMIEAGGDGEEADEDPAAYLRAYGIDTGEDVGGGGRPCPECRGARLNRVSRAVKLCFQKGPPLSLPELLRSTPAELIALLRHLALDARGRAITQDILPGIEERLKFLARVGLGYLALDRPTESLSGGEAQRIRLAAQLGSNLSGVLYVLDEPTIGLHARDNERLIDTLESLRDKGNTLLVVEHDDTVMERADRIIDLGPGAGIHGGRLIASDTPANLRRNRQSLTGLYLDKGIKHPVRGAYRDIPRWSVLPSSRMTSRRSKRVEVNALHPAWLELKGAAYRNLKSIDLRLPLGRLIMVCGASGAGKSTLFCDLLHPAAACAIKQRKTRLTGREFMRTTGFEPDDLSAAFLHSTRSRRREEADRTMNAGELPRDLGSYAKSQPRLRGAGSSDIRHPVFKELCGADGFKSVIEVDQSPIGKTPRSTPATYLGIFDLIREFFASLPEARVRGYTASRFSFNTTGGRCETCKGAGRIRLEMAFMPDAHLPCEGCGGLRYGSELADIAWKGRNIGQVLQLTFEEAAGFFDFHAKLGEVCRLMCDCGLGYLTLGQSSPTLSGGEAQRLKLVSELARGLQTFAERSRGIQPCNLYLLEEPTIGLHLSDCEKLIRVLHGLVDQGHTVIVIEHHLDLLAEADWLVELGPGGGPGGGEIIHQGPITGLLKLKRSPTAPYLRKKLNPPGASAPEGSPAPRIRGWARSPTPDGWESASGRRPRAPGDTWL